MFTVTCIVDTGSTGHFLTVLTPCLNLGPASPGISVVTPDGDIITLTHTSLLNLQMLLPAACTAHVFPTLTSGSLISIGTLCDHG
jgi:hypothetical protein